MWTRQTERHDLDAWAKALGVRTDNDAYNALERLQVQLHDISSSLRALREKVTGSRTSTGSDIEADMDEASARTMYAADGLGSVMTSFDRHERGAF